eukprot:gene36588-59723_t
MLLALSEIQTIDFGRRPDGNDPSDAMPVSFYSPASASSWSDLPATERMPVLFVGHGSPMNAIEDNHWRQRWQALGSELLARAQPPRLILCISAHWLTPGWQLTAMAQPRTIHDFGGFPQALFDIEYPAPGHPALARETVGAVKQAPVIGTDQW